MGCKEYQKGNYKILRTEPQGNLPKFWNTVKQVLKWKFLVCNTFANKKIKIENKCTALNSRIWKKEQGAHTQRNKKGNIKTKRNNQ